MPRLFRSSNRPSFLLRPAFWLAAALLMVSGLVTVWLFLLPQGESWLVSVFALAGLAAWATIRSRNDDCVAGRGILVTMADDDPAGTTAPHDATSPGPPEAGSSGKPESGSPGTPEAGSTGNRWDATSLDMNELLGRRAVPPIPGLLDACIRDRSVVVTGAGGSIGAELCRQIAEIGPRTLILYEQSELALYQINNILARVANADSALRIVPLLGALHDERRMLQIFSTFAVDTVYHAAAYKHTHLVERNAVEGIRNNIFGTLHAARAAIAANVRSFVLVSTDKAVKPVNVMGATKRYAELTVKALAAGAANTVLSIVRFGNVLESSGSVVPLFREQILAGGPVTVTDPEVRRYFMTIPEAASLVIQAGSLARGGETFVLDMGPPVHIRDLAGRMILLMGRAVADRGPAAADVEIRYIGLKPEEKLCEEPLVDDDAAPTLHPKIFRVENSDVQWPDMKRSLEALAAACATYDCDAALRLLREAPIDYSPIQEMVDPVHNAGAGASE